MKFHRSQEQNPNAACCYLTNGKINVLTTMRKEKDFSSV